MSGSLPPPPLEDGLAYELVKLLLQVAWADDEVAPEEARALEQFATEWGLTEEQRSAVHQCLSGECPLPPPNLGLLKQHRLEVLRRVKQLLQSDHVVNAAESGVLEQIALLLR